jgi:GNAT superfamily N-acetyltransferase
MSKEISYPDTVERARAVRVADAQTPSQIASAAELMRAFVVWQHVRHGEHPERLAAYFDPTGFEEELVNLPAPYQRPNGALLLATVDDEPAGCIALKPLADGVCEMKRLYLKPEFHGLGIGRLLVSRLIDEASAIGYTSMRLETGPLQHEAQGLYAEFGFRRIPPYRDLPDCLRDWLICMERPRGAGDLAAPRPRLRVAASA